MKSVTFKPIVVSSNRRRDGTYPVKIRVTYKGVTRRLATTLIAHPQDLTRSLKIKNPDILNKANELIARMQGTLADLSFLIDDWDVDRVVRHIKDRMAAKEFRLDFYAWADTYLQTKGESTRRTYETALKALKEFAGELDINDITRAKMQEFGEWLDNGNKRGGKVKRTPGASTRYLSKIAHIFQAAKERYNDDDKTLIPRSPFHFPKVQQIHTGQKALPVDLMQRIVDSPVAGKERKALDVFLVSFGLMGANIADLWAARECDKVWVYNRQKTKDRRQDRAEMRVEIPGEIREILDRLQDGPSGWLIPWLHNYPNKDSASVNVNYWLRRWTEREGVDGFSFYAARKSWATIARKEGIEKATIDECLAHIGDYQTADIYIEKSWDLLNEANRKVVSVLHF